MRTTLRDDERGAVGAERIAVWILALLAAGFAVAIVVQPGVLAASPPDATFDERYDAETNTLQITHAGGDVIRDGTTSALVVVLSANDGDVTQNVTWVADGEGGVGSFPVGPDDRLLIDDATADANGDGNSFDGDATVGFDLDGGGTATVVWRGRPRGAAEERTVTLDTVSFAAEG